MNYAEKTRRKMIFQAGAAVSLLMILSVLVFMKLQPATEWITIEDSCGPVGNTISHTISSEDQCENSCVAACLSFGKEFVDRKFEYNQEVRCNSCECLCRV